MRGYATRCLSTSAWCGQLGFDRPGALVAEGAPYGADMRLFIRFGGMPCVMYGAGDVNVAHAPDEYVSITELLTATKTVACLLVEWYGAVDANSAD